jgi:hypothetical protein
MLMLPKTTARPESTDAVVEVLHTLNVWNIWNVTPQRDLARRAPVRSWINMSERYKALIPWSAAALRDTLQEVHNMLSNFRLGSFTVLAAALALSTTDAQTQCPDFTSFSQSPQGNVSTGPLKLPFMRPSPECRTFTSPAVEVSDWSIQCKETQSTYGHL